MKEKEWEKYLQGEKTLSDLEYPHDIREYIKEKTSFAVGELAYVETRLVTSEPRRQIAFESIIPSGSELVNTVFATETKGVVTKESFFDHEEFRDDRYFGTKETLESGDYTI